MLKWPNYFCIVRYLGAHLGITLQWRHNERDGVSNHRCIDALLNRLFWRRSKKTQKLRGHRWLVNSPHKGPVIGTKKLFDDVCITHLCLPEHICKLDHAPAVQYNRVTSWYYIAHEFLIHLFTGKPTTTIYNVECTYVTTPPYFLDCPFIFLRSVNDSDILRALWRNVYLSEFRPTCTQLLNETNKLSYLMFMEHCVALIRWCSARVQYLQWVNNWDTAVWHYTIDICSDT